MALRPGWLMICTTAWDGVVASQYGRSCDLVKGYEDEEGNRYWTGGYEYTSSSDDFLKCLRSGCLWCRFLGKKLMYKWPVGKVRVQVGLDSESEKEDFIFIFDGLAEGFSLHALEGDPAAKSIKKRILIPHVGAPYALAMAKTCIERCVRDHPKCQAITPYPVGATPLPTRLIDCSDIDCLRIVETDPSMRGTYVALSYVWGEAQPYITTESTLSRYKMKIDVALPRTILDAIHVTRTLGIYLLWIDGLCIVQDSEKDMHHELMRMRDVYRHAYLTIDASSAANVSEGFLHDRQLNPEPYATLPFVCPPDDLAKQSADGEQVGMVYVANRGATYCSSREGEKGFCIGNHTASRGWCLQERLLSTRSLTFTTQTLQLRCHTETHNVGGADHDDTFDTPPLPDAVFYPDRHIPHDSDEWMDVSRRWRDIVCDYSRGKLSNPSDKLIAISAVAEMFAPVLGPDYLAGLWHHSLLQDLLWYAAYRFSHRPPEYRGPSWSWASTNDYVLWSTHSQEDLLAEVVKCTVTLQNQQLPFGAVTGASLILRSSFLPCKCFVRKTKSGISTQRISLDLPFFSSYVLEEPFRCDEDPSLLEEREVWFVPLLLRCGFFPVGLVGLVVTRAEIDVWRRAGEQGEGDVYRRVAVAQYSTAGRTTKRSDANARMIEDQRTQVRDMLSQIPLVDIELV